MAIGYHSNLRRPTLIRMRLALLVLGILLCVPVLTAQERAEEWRLARLKKVDTLQSPSSSRLETLLDQVKEQKLLERFEAGFKGFHPRLGGLATGSGFAIGSEFRKEGLAGINLRASAQASLR